MRGGGCRCHTDPVLRCLIVDDNIQFLGSASSMLERQGVDVVAVATTVELALRMVEALRPDAALVDIDLGDESGFALARRLADRFPESRVVLISTAEEDDYADLVAASPAVGFVSKSDLSAGALCRLLSGGAAGDDSDLGRTGPSERPET